MSNGNMIKLSSDSLRATIRLAGAQLISLERGNGLELLWHGDPEIWPEHAPNLFPLLGPLTNQQLRHNGKTYDIPPHGFAQAETFEVVEQSENACLLQITDTDETRSMYPFAFRLQIEFRLLDNALHQTMRVSNTGDETLPCDVGFHPGFQWPLDPELEKEAYRIRFEKDEPAGIRRGVDDPIFLYGEPHPTPVQDDTLPLSDNLFEDQAIVFDRLNSRAVTYEADDGPSLHIEFPDSPYLALWMRPGASFIAIEPWQGLPVEYGWDGEYTEKPGTALIEPGSTERWHLVVTLR